MRELIEILWWCQSVPALLSWQEKIVNWWAFVVEIRRRRSQKLTLAAKLDEREKTTCLMLELDSTSTWKLCGKCLLIFSHVSLSVHRIECLLSIKRSTMPPTWMSGLLMIFLGKKANQRHTMPRGNFYIITSLLCHGNPGKPSIYRCQGIFYTAFGRGASSVPKITSQNRLVTPNPFS